MLTNAALSALLWLATGPADPSVLVVVEANDPAALAESLPEIEAALARLEHAHPGCMLASHPPEPGGRFLVELEGLVASARGDRCVA